MATVSIAAPFKEYQAYIDGVEDGQPVSVFSKKGLNTELQTSRIFRFE